MPQKIGRKSGDKHISYTYMLPSFKDKKPDDYPGKQSEKFYNTVNFESKDLNKVKKLLFAKKISHVTKANFSKKRMKNKSTYFQYLIYNERDKNWKWDEPEYID